MTKFQDDVAALDAALWQFIQANMVGSIAARVPTPIVAGHPVHNAVLAVEAHSGGLLPDVQAIEQWHRLVRLSRNPEEGDNGAAVYSAWRLRDWCRAQLDAPKATPVARLVLHRAADVATIDGEDHPLTPDQTHLLFKLIAAAGGWVQGATLVCTEGGRADRIKGRMPGAIQGVIEAKTGAGYRLTCTAAVA